MNSNETHFNDLAEIANLYPRNTNTIDEVTNIRAEARLEQILADPQGNANQHRHYEKAQTRSAQINPKLKWSLIPLAAITVTALSLMLPGNLGANNAFASWTPAPATLNSNDLKGLFDTCRPSDFTRQAHSLPNIPDMAEIAAHPTVAERRGDWALAAWVNPPDAQNPWGQTYSCLALRVADQWEMVHANAQWGPGGDTATDWAHPGPQLAEQQQLAAHTELDPRQIEYRHGGYVEIRNGHPLFGQGLGTQVRGDLGFTTVRSPAGDALGSLGQVSGTMTYAFGQVGDDVAALALRIPTGTVSATIENGWFLAWWPVDSARGAVGRTRGYTVTTLDGIVLPKRHLDW